MNSVVPLTLSLEDDAFVPGLLRLWTAAADLLSGFDPNLVRLFAFPAGGGKCRCRGLVPHGWLGLFDFWLVARRRDLVPKMSQIRRSDRSAIFSNIQHTSIPA